MLIETDRIQLRRWRDEDRQPFSRMNRDPAVMRYLGPALTRNGSDAAIDKQIALMEQGEPAFWAAASRGDDKLLGCIGVKAVTFEAAFTPCYEIGWRLASQYWGRGYATEGAKAALELAFGRWKMPKIYSFTVLANIKSQSVMEKIGMSRVEHGEFNHPALSKDDPLLRHVLYRIERP